MFNFKTIANYWTTDFKIIACLLSYDFNFAYFIKSFTYFATFTFRFMLLESSFTYEDFNLQIHYFNTFNFKFYHGL